MGTLDIILLICFAPALVTGIQKGFVEQVVSIVSILVGAWLAYRFAGVVGVWLAQYINLEPRILGIVSFAVVVIITVLVLNLIGKILTKTLSLASLGFVDRLLGVAFALLKAALLIGLAVFTFDSLNVKWGLVNPEILEGSVVYTALRDAALKVFPYLKDLLNI